jgi:hypothetical protein
LDPLDSPEVQDASMAPMLFFPHDADSATDERCRRLILRLGYDGYGRWWRLCEMMASTPGHAVPCATEEDRMMLCDELRCDDGELSALLGALADFGLVPADVLAGGRIASEGMADGTRLLAEWCRRHMGDSGAICGDGTTPTGK